MTSVAHVSDSSHNKEGYAVIYNVSMLFEL